MAENIAEHLKLKFYAISVCSQSSEYLLKGYYDANGHYVKSQFREAYENGGVFLIDEIDAGNPNIVACLNGALSNHVCSFPDGMVRKHDDFVLVAAANTFGTGASREYVGRNSLDAATLDRFAFVEMAYDEGLEYSMVGDNTHGSPKLGLLNGDGYNGFEWVAYVLKVRKAIAKIGLKTVVSPRASKMGALMLAAGIGSEWVKRMLIFKGLDAASVEKLRAEILATKGGE
jgi:hypothetical protein